jgi:hypothetical protein
VELVLIGSHHYNGHGSVTLTGRLRLWCASAVAVSRSSPAQLVTWILVSVVVFSIVYFLAVFAAELYVICAPRRASKGKDKEYAAGKTDKAVDVAMNPMFTSAALARRRSTLAVGRTPAEDGTWLKVHRAPQFKLLIEA